MSKLPDWVNKKIDRILQNHINDESEHSVLDFYRELSPDVRPEHIPRSLQMLAHKMILCQGIKERLKRKLPENVVRAISASMPRSLARELGVFDGWIALGKGPNAPWVSSIAASDTQWDRNAALKKGIGRPTIAAAHKSEDMARFLRANGVRCIGDLMHQQAA